MATKINGEIELDAWWAASDGARASWDTRTRNPSEADALSILRVELNRLLTEEMGRSEAFAVGLVKALPDWADPREWFLNMIAFYSAKIETGLGRTRETPIPPLQA